MPLQLQRLGFSIGAAALLAVAATGRGENLPCYPFNFGPEIGAPATGFEILTDQLSKCGVVFSTDDPEGVYWIGGGGYSPFTYCIFAGAQPFAGGPPAGVDRIRIDFTSQQMIIWITAFDDDADVETMILETYGPSGLLDSQQVTDTFEFPGQRVVAGGGVIEYMTVRVEGTTSGLFFDDLGVFSSVSVSAESWGSTKASYR